MSGSLSLANDELIPFAEFVAKLKISPRTGRRIISSGAVGVCRIQGSVRIPKSSLEAYLSSCFSPPREIHKEEPQTVVAILDRALPRKRAAQ